MGKTVIEIKTISFSDPKTFDSNVNLYLSKGWELHGAPSITTVAEQRTWDGRVNSHKVTTYSQILTYSR